MRKQGRLNVSAMCSSCIILFIAILIPTKAVEAAKVKAINKKKGLIKIDEGKLNGFIKKAKVCVFNKKGKKIACGRVRKANKKSAYVKISKKRIKRVKKGYDVRLKTPKIPTIAGEDAAIIAAISDHRTNIKLAWLVSVLTPAVYNKLTYLPPYEKNESDVYTIQSSADSIWKNEDSSSLSILGFVLESEFSVGDSAAMSVGLRYRAYRPFVAQADYIPKTENLDQFIETEQEATAIGFYADYTYLDIALGDAIFWRNAVGLDIDMSTQTFKATHKVAPEDGKDPSGEELGEIAKATTKLTIASLRLGTNFNWMVFEPVGAILGLNLLVPLATFAESYSGEVSDPHVVSNEVLGSGVDGKDDLKEAINHTKASFGAEVILGAYFAF